jgi:hypothetical protein
VASWVLTTQQCLQKPALSRHLQTPADTPLGGGRRCHRNSQLLKRYRLVNGRLEGARVIYQPSRCMDRGMTHRAGRPDGLRPRREIHQAAFYPTGALHSRAQYHQRPPDVKGVRLYQRGTISKKVPNAAGARVVTVLTYDKDGRLKRSVAVNYAPSRTQRRFHGCATNPYCLIYLLVRAATGTYCAGAIMMWVTARNKAPA